MRNLKRALSLGLTAAMVSGLMVMGSSAASYADVTSENNQEAIEVLKAVGIMTGDDKGNFNPEQKVTRNEMAVVMSNLMAYNVATYKDTSPFTDVPAWAEPYVAACYTNGITSGYTATTYGGSDSVTTAQAALMLMKALGYFQYSSDFGDDWMLSTAAQGNKIDLFDDVDSSLREAMTRNDLAQLVLNTLESGTVEAETNGSFTVGGVTVTNSVKYNYLTSNANYADSIHNVKSTSGTTDANKFVVELGEKLYQGDLRLREDTTDDFGRPARTWSYENSEIGTYAETPDLTYTAKVEAGDVYKDLGLGKNVNKSDVTVYVDGQEEDDLSLSIRKGSSDKVGLSGNGVLTEVYYDEDDNTVLAVQVNTYVGTVVKTVDATDKRDAYVIVAPEAPLTGTAPISSNEEFETDKDFDTDAYVLYTYSKTADEIKSVELAEEVVGEVTRAENDRENIKDAKALTIDGTRYKDSVMVAGETLGDISVDETYTVYLDSYGYMIYVEENDEIGDYALLYNVANRGSFVGKKAELVFADGTMAVVNTDKNYTDIDNLKLGDITGDGKVNADDQAAFYDSKNGGLQTPIIVTYREDDDGVYSLRAVDTDKASYSNSTDDLVLKNDKAGIKVNDFGVNSTKTTTANANSATTFVVADPGSDEDYTAYTGIKNAPSIDVTGAADLNDKADVYYYCKTGKMVTVMFILPGTNVEVEDDSNKSIYLANESVSNLIHDRNGDYYIFQAVVDGEIKDVMVDENVTVDGTVVTNAKALNGIFKSYSTDKYDIITSLKTFGTVGTEVVDDRTQPKDTYTGNTDSKEYVSLTGIDKVSKDYTVLVGYISKDNYKDTITVDEDADIFYVDEDGKISVSSYNGIAIDTDDKVYAVVEDYMVQTLVVEEIDEKDNAKSATVDILYNNAAAGNKITATQNGTATLTADVTLTDPKHDEVISYQWYKAPAGQKSPSQVKENGTKVGAGASFTVPTTTLGTTHYYVVVETYNDRVTGDDTAETFDVVEVEVVEATQEVNVVVYFTTDGDKTGLVPGSKPQIVKLAAVGGVLVTVTADDVNDLIPAGYKLAGTPGLPAFITVGDTAEVPVKVVAKSNDTSVASVDADYTDADGGTVSASGKESAGTVTITLSNGSAANGDTVKVTLNLTDTNATAESVTLTYNGTEWTGDKTITVTAENGTTASYTVTVA